MVFPSKLKKSLRSIVIASLAINLYAGAFAQTNTDKVLLRIEDEEITSSEFLRVYNKNNTQGEVLDKKSLEEYLDLYINFKLKVKEAEKQGLDTVASFIKELSGYRAQLAKPYLIDEEVNEALLREAFQRKQEDIRASHILIKVDENASPADTLRAWNRIIGLRNDILKGKNFNAIAEKQSDDLSARNRPVQGRVIPGNQGDLGYFSVFDMVYPFETAAYNTKTGDISMPARTRFGYHIIKVTDRKPAMGKVQVAHILLIENKEGKAGEAEAFAKKAQIEKIYTEITEGLDFKEAAKKYSEDRNSAPTGGVLPWFGSNRMIPDFIAQIASLDSLNPISKPFHTRFGWHIVKLLDCKPVGSFDDEKGDLKNKLAKNDRAIMSKESFVKKVKNEYHFTEDLNAMKAFYTLVDTNIFNAKWEKESIQDHHKVIFSLGTAKITQQDFASYLEKNQHRGPKMPINIYVDEQYAKFMELQVVNYEDSQLERKYPDFKALMQEYRDGILLFELTDTKIWKKAVQDTTGLETFYANNKTNYMWDKRVDASIYTISDAAKVQEIKKNAAKGASDEELLKQFNNDSIVCLTIEHKKYLKGDNELIDGVKWKRGVKKATTNDKTHTIINIHKIIKPEPKALNEARGLIISDYQNELEAAWVKELRTQYTINIDQEVFSSIQK